MSNLVLMKTLLKIHCCIFASFKQECDYIFNKVKGWDVNQENEELRSCGIQSSEFIKIALPFSTLDDIDSLKRTTRYANAGRHTSIDIRTVVTRRRVAYPNRGSAEAEHSMVKSVSEKLIRDNPSNALLADKYGALPLYSAYQNTNIANLAWRVEKDIQFRVTMKNYPRASDLKIRKWKGMNVLCFQDMMECIIFPDVVLPLLKSYGVRQGSAIDGIVMKSMAHNRKGKERVVSTGRVEKWNDGDIDIYFPEEDWLKGGALQQMITASKKGPLKWRQFRVKD